jgi:hypothetical protein
LQKRQRRHNHCRKGREDVNDEERQAAPITTQIGENVVKIGELVQSVRWLTCRMIHDELHTSKETIRKILVQDLGMGKLAVKFVPQNLMEEQKDIHLTLWNNFKIFFSIMSSLVMKPGVISMIPRPSASPWNGS